MNQSAAERRTSGFGRAAAPLASANGTNRRSSAWTDGAARVTSATMAEMSGDRTRTHPNEAAFPKGLSGPALRALANAGVDSMADVARWSDADLIALHGFGARGLRVVRDALHATAGRQHRYS